MVVVEPSSDRNLEVARAAAKDFPELKVIANTVHRGKGFAVRTGMLAGRGEMLFFTDSDLSTPLPDLEHVIAPFKEKPEIDLSVVRRTHPDIQIFQHQIPSRQL